MFFTLFVSLIVPGILRRSVKPKLENLTSLKLILEQSLSIFPFSFRREMILILSYSMHEYYIIN